MTRFADLESADALAQLSRRRFLQGLGAAGGGLAFGSLADAARAWASTPLPASDGILVVLLLGGGNDGINTVAPIGNGRYYDKRKGLALPGASTQYIGQGFGLHRNLPYLKSLYDEGHVALLQGVGYTPANRSHFDSMALWMRGQANGGSFTGWLGRWLDGAADPGPLHAVNIGVNVPLHLAGASRVGSSVAPWGMSFGDENDGPHYRLNQAIRSMANGPTGLGTWGDITTGVTRDALDIGAALKPAFATALPAGDAARDMALAARMINLDIGTRVVGVTIDGFDNHSGQLVTHAKLLASVDAGLRSLFGTLQPRFANRTTVLVFSEFGRTPDANDSQGTDHGSANTTMLIGPGIAGGIYGALPSFDDLDENRCFKANLDFRHIYATVLDKVLGADSTQILGARYETLPVFSGAALPEIPAPPPLPVVPGRLLAITPDRRLDTRSAVGAPQSPFHAGIEETVLVLGSGGVPGQDVTAVVMNVTVTAPTDAGFVTVWPTGETKPNASSLNFRAGQTVPNLVLSKVGANGRVSLAVSSGKADLIADVVGYYSKSGGSTLQPMTPVRLRDTRNEASPVGPGATLRVEIAGQAGLPASGVAAVVLNVTVTGPTAAGFVTVWPSGEGMPNASSLNFTPGLTVPNLVIAKLGADGAVSLFNSGGSTHLIVDLLGWFDAGGGGAAVSAISPTRMLDTRNSGVKAGPASVTGLRVAGVAGVPGDATAVVLNMTVTGPTEAGYLTVWPTGQARPDTSNLNFSAGQTVPNHVIATVGASGEISIYNHSGSTHLIADLVGFYR